MFHRCFKDVSSVFQVSFKCVSIKFQGTFNGECFKKDFKGFQCSFKGISKKLRKFPVSFQDVFKAV